VHYEADLTRGGRSVLDIRPLLWTTDGWPVAGDNLVDGTYQIVSRQSENTLEVHIPATPAAKPTGATSPPGTKQDAPSAPTGPPTVRVARYLTLDDQKWTIESATGGFSKIVNVGTGDALGATGVAAEQGFGVSISAYNGADSQLWHLDQFPDGGYRIRNKIGVDLMTLPGGGVVLGIGPFVRNDLYRWAITTP
jgi:arabinan endo-1,5-alpha-L-arabinosidase